MIPQTSPDAIIPGTTTLPPEQLVVRFSLEALFKPNGATADQLKERVHRLLERAMQDWGLEGETGAEVMSSAMATQCLAPASFNLTEERLAAWFKSQLDDGHISAERIPVMLARYALADPASMREEFAERMALSDASGDGDGGPAEGRFLVSDNWGHIFQGTHEEQTRWAVEMHTGCLVDAQRLTGMHVNRWENLDQDQVADLIEDLKDNDLPQNADELVIWDLSADVYLVDSLPAWAQRRLDIALVPAETIFFDAPRV